MELHKLEETQEQYQKENENQKWEHAEFVQKLSEEREHYQCEDEYRKTEHEQMVSKTQTIACMVMNLTKNTHEENGNLQADIKSTWDSLNKDINQLNDATLNGIESIAKRLKWLQRQQLNKSKTPPKNTVRQPNTVPPDIMDIDTVTQLTTATSTLKTALLATALKTR